MIRTTLSNLMLGCAALALLASCGSFEADPNDGIPQPASGRGAKQYAETGPRTSLLDIFLGDKSSVKVNRFLWTASLDVLSFLPLEVADPFTGVISTGYGRPPGGGRAYRATVLISDPALDARSLKVTLATSSGPVAEETRRAVEDAILGRARQLRIQAGKY